MLLADTLVVVGMAVAQLGTINEADGPQQRSFWLRNDGQQAITMVQGYTSCHCTTLNYEQGRVVAPGDSACVRLVFNPQGKGGEFYESGTIVYGAQKKRITVAIEGDCITSEETLLRQFPVRVDDNIRLSVDRLDLGIMHVGETKERNIVVLYRNENNRREVQTIKFTVGKDTPKGLQHISHPVSIHGKDTGRKATVTLDVLVK